MTSRVRTTSLLAEALHSEIVYCQHDFFLKTSSSPGSHGDLHMALLLLTPGLRLPHLLLPPPSPTCPPSPRALMGPVCSAHSAQGFNGHPYTDSQAHSLAQSPLLHSRLTSATSPPEGLTRNLNTRNIQFSGWMNVPRPTPYTLLLSDGSSKQAALPLFLMYFQQDTW